MPQARRKGKSGELEVVHILRDAGWPDARRTHDGFSQADRGDIAGGPADISWECKRVERLELWPALEQAASDAGPKVPVLAFRRSRSRWYAALPLDELLALLRRQEEEEEEEPIPPGSLCGMLMVGSGDDTYDPTCELPVNHPGICRSSSAIDQHRL